MAESQLQDDGSIFRPAVRRGVYIVCVLSAAAYLVSMLWGRRLSDIQATPQDSYGNGPIGHRALAEFAEGLGFHVLQNRSSNYAGPETPMLFVAPSTEARVDGHIHELWRSLDARRDADRPSIVVLPKWDMLTGPSGAPIAGEPAHPVAPGHLGQVLRAALSAPGQEPLEEDLLTVDEGETFQVTGLLGEFEVSAADLQVLKKPPANALVLLETEAGALALEHDGVLLLTDPGLLLNYNLHRSDHGALVAALLAYHTADTIIIDETFHGHGRSYSLGAALGEFPAILIVVQGIVVLLLLLASGMHRFGPPAGRRMRDGGPGALITVTGQVLADGTPSVNLVHLYLVALFDDLLHRNNTNPEGLPNSEKARLTDGIANRFGVPAKAEDLLLRAGSLPRGADAEAFAVAREAHEFYRRLLPSRSQETTA